MAYNIVWLRGSFTLGTEEFELLDSAIGRAREGLPDMNARFQATAVKVVDEKGSPHFLESVGGR